jgi:hypothetical protein
MHCSGTPDLTAAMQPGQRSYLCEQGLLVVDAQGPCWCGVTQGFLPLPLLRTAVKIAIRQHQLHVRALMVGRLDLDRPDWAPTPCDTS